MTSCFQNSQKHKISLSNTDNFTLKYFFIAECKFVTWDLKVRPPSIGKSYHVLLFKIDSEIAVKILEKFQWKSLLFSNVTASRSVNLLKLNFVAGASDL